MVWWFSDPRWRGSLYDRGRVRGDAFFFGKLSHAVSLWSSSCLHLSDIPLRARFSHLKLQAIPWHVDGNLCARSPISSQKSMERPWPYSPPLSVDMRVLRCGGVEIFEYRPYRSKLCSCDPARPLCTTCPGHPRIRTRAVVSLLFRGLIHHT